LTGGALCLDFANTVSSRKGDARIERLNSYDDLIAFGQQAKIIDASEQRALRSAARQRPHLAARAYKNALMQRAMIDRIFTNIVSGTDPKGSDMSALNNCLVEVGTRMRVDRDGKAYTWRDTGTVFDRILAPIVRSAAALLTSPQLTQLRRCNAADCGWLFVDLSGNQRRRWCDMRVCGNRAKARRHHQRLQRKTSELPD
jgi:predicted RNA-binding Zn ribbon-like protein